MNNLFTQSFFAILFLIFVSCSNGGSVNSVEESVGLDGAVVTTSSRDPDSLEHIPFDDSEYPYVGLPRIVIETEN